MDINAFYGGQSSVKLREDSVTNGGRIQQLVIKGKGIIRCKKYLWPPPTISAGKSLDDNKISTTTGWAGMPKPVVDETN